MEIHTLLEMPPFQDITEEELLSLILAPEHAHRQYKPADFIAMQGEAYRSLFILCNGSVRTQMVSAEGKQLTIETLKAPQLLAPAFVFASENRFPVNIEAKEKCEILVINKNIFLEFLHQHPAVMRNFLQLVSDRTLFLSKKLNAFALQSLKSRILNYTHAWHDTQPAGSGTNTGSGASLAGTCLIGTGKRRVHPNGREGNADKCSLRPKVFIKNVRTYILFLPLSKNKKLWKRFYWMKSTNSCCSKSLY